MLTTNYPAPVSALTDHAGFWLRFVSNHVSAEFRRLVEQNGMSVSEWVALRLLFDHEHSSAADLVQALGMTKGAVSKIVARLQAKGMLQQTAATDDKRARRLALSAAGRAMVPLLAGLADQNDARFFGALAPQQRAALVAILKQVAQGSGMTQVPVE